MRSRSAFVREYHDNLYRGEELDEEMRLVARFLAANVRGKTLDFGCGPALYFWACFMPDATRIDGIDLAPESIGFLRSVALSEGLYPAARACDPMAQFAKVGKIVQADFTKEIALEKDYETIVAPYSIGCVATVDEYRAAIENLERHLRPGGIALFIGTTGTNASEDLPEYCYRGVRNSLEMTREEFARLFGAVEFEQIALEQAEGAMFPHSALILGKAVKQS